MNVDFATRQEMVLKSDFLNTRGYFGIGIFQPQKDVNIGTLFRSAYSMGASFIFTIGRKYTTQSSDTVKAYKHVPLFNYVTFDNFLSGIPRDCMLIGVELDKRSRPLRDFTHPERSIYLLGSEGKPGLPEYIREKCHALIQLPGRTCLNVSVAGSIVLYDRLAKNACRS